MAQERKHKSCYARHHKKPYLYSRLLREWEEAARSGDEQQMELRAAQHRRCFDY